MKSKELENKIIFLLLLNTFFIYFSSFVWIGEVGGKIHWSAKVHKSFHRWKVYCFAFIYSLLSCSCSTYTFDEKKDRFYSTATQREHLCIDIFSELQWYPLISLRFVSSHRMNKNTKIPNGMTVKTANKTKSKYRHDTVCTATNTECRLSLFIS